jgi:uncharacterized pyridoxamine 5'-phosphate oxidase family protein
MVSLQFIVSTKHHRLTAGQVYDDEYVRLISTLRRKNKIQFVSSKKDLRFRRIKESSLFEDSRFIRKSFKILYPLNSENLSSA